MPHVSEPPQIVRPHVESRLRFIVGQSPEGYWLAVETHGLGGGLFRSREAAVGYVAAETGRRPGAIEVATDVLTLAP